MSQAPKDASEGESPLVIFQPSITEEHGIQYETWLTLSNPSDDIVRSGSCCANPLSMHVTAAGVKRHSPQIAFKIKLNKSKRYMVKPYQVVVRGEQFPLLMAKLQRALPSESTAVDGYVAWDIDDKFQVQRAVLPMSLRGQLPSEEEMSSSPKDAANTITSVVSDLWTSVSKQSVSSSVLLSRFMVPVGVLRRLASDSPEDIVASDLGEEVQAAAAAAHEAAQADDDYAAHAAAAVAPAPAAVHTTSLASKEAAAAQEKLLELRELYTSAMREQTRQEAVRSNLEESMRARDSRIVQLERAAADLRAQVESANARAAALEIDGADVQSAGEDSPSSGLRKRGQGAGAMLEAGSGVGDGGPHASGFALWQVALVAIVMFLVGRIV